MRRFLLVLSLLAFSSTASADEPCRRGLAAPDPLVSDDFQASDDLRAVYGDLDEDGTTDMAIGTAILLNRGGVFERKVTFAGTWSPDAVGDQNGDGHLDLIDTNDAYSNPRIAVRLGRGDGTFGESIESTFTAAFDSPYGSRFLDVDGDGRLDVVRGGWLFLSEGDGRFRFMELRQKTGQQILRGFFDYAVADFDGDGDVDFYGWQTTYHTAYGAYILFRNDGNFVFDTPSVEHTHRAPERMVPADTDGDGIPELIGLSEKLMIIVHSVGKLTVETAPFNSETPFVVLGTMDFDGDGRLEHVIQSFFGHNAGFLRRRPDGAFEEEYFLIDGRWFTLHDFDRDGILDLVSRTGTAVVRGGSPVQAPRLYSIRGAGWNLHLQFVDMNGDGNLDQLIGYTDPVPTTRIEVRLGDGHGNYTYHDHETVPFPNSLVMEKGDFDRDGNIDVVVNVAYQTRSYILFGDGTGGFAGMAPFDANWLIAASSGNTVGFIATVDTDHRWVTVSSGRTVSMTSLFSLRSDQSVALHDLDADPDLEMLVRRIDGTYEVRDWSSGNWTLSSISLGAGFGVRTSGDLNDDGLPDLVMGDRIALGRGNGVFEPQPADWSIAGEPVIADFDRDGLPDLVWLYSGGYETSVSVLRNRGGARFEPYAAARLNTRLDTAHALAFQVVDFDGDGWPDVVARMKDGAVAVARNVCGGQDRLHVAVLPAVVHEGDRVTLLVHNVNFAFDVVSSSTTFTQQPGRSYGTVTVTTGALSAGEHVFEIRSRHSFYSDVEIVRVQVHPRLSRRRSVRH